MPVVEEMYVRDRYWWVNQGKTWEQERRGGYLWAPTHAPNGQTKNFWTRMLDVREGDRIVSYVRGSVVAVSTAVADGYRAPRPAELPVALWAELGYRVDVEYRPLPRPIERDEISELWRFGSKEEPFRRDGAVKQGYLFPISSSFFTELMKLAQYRV
jgi:5-methylcytosine-specific restriction enzyme B